VRLCLVRLLCLVMMRVEAVYGGAAFGVPTSGAAASGEAAFGEAVFWLGCSGEACFG
jgi:hypothetical protein